MNNFIILTLMLLLPMSALPQDERYFRQIFSGELMKPEDRPQEKKYSYFVHTPFYDLDLNLDGKTEQIVFVKKDSEDWIEIFEAQAGAKNKIFAYQFETKGFNSELYRIEFKKLSSFSRVLLLHYYEGLTHYTQLQGSSRIYALTIDGGNLKSLTVFKGPSIFEEYKTLKKNYHLRDYDVYLKDLNDDEIKELIVKHRDISQVYLYSGDGTWKTFRN